MEFTLTFVEVLVTELVIAAPIILSLLLLISFIGYIIGRTEGWSKFDGLYHAFINATTVGYGDLRPTKRLSKSLAIANALVGLILTGIVVAIGLHATDYALSKVTGTAGFLG